AMDRLLRNAYACGSSQDTPLWTLTDRKVAGSAWFRAVWKTVTGMDAWASSFRAGGATQMALAGNMPETIGKVGMWNSTAWENYVRKRPGLVIAELLNGLSDSGAEAMRSRLERNS
ncbi:hypothetical protein HK097_003027, partial [Rhizophlyctis rosea]